MLALVHAADNGNGASDPLPVRQLLRPGPVDDAERAAMADSEDTRPVRHPTRAGGARNQPGRVFQRKGRSHGTPSGIAHPDDDRRVKKSHKWTQVSLGASVDPASKNGPCHRPLLD